MCQYLRVIETNHHNAKRMKKVPGSMWPISVPMMRI